MSDLFKTEFAFRELPKVNQSKVRLLRAGPMIYKGEHREFSVEDLKEIASETRRLIFNCEQYAAEGEDQTAWTPPILREHNPNGARDGDIITAEVSGDELFSRVKWREDTWQEILSETVEFVSIHIISDYEDMRGEKYSRVIWEASLTGHPVRKDIGRIQDTLQLSDSLIFAIDITTEEGEIMEEFMTLILERMDAQDAAIAAIAEAVSTESVAAAEGEEEEATEEATEEGASEEEEEKEEIKASEAAAFAEFQKTLIERMDKQDAAILLMSEKKGLRAELGGDPGNPKAPTRDLVAKQAEFAAQGMTQAQAIGAALGAK